jgi:methionyl-tRNA formyltransferase
MRIVYCGTPVDATPPLRALHDAGHDLAMVVTQPDRRRGRGGDTFPSPVKVEAERLGLEVHTPSKARDVVAAIAALRADLGVVVAFGQLLPRPLLDATRLGFVNLHFSLLPRWRGAAPVERALLAGDEETGVCVMQLDEGLDTGPVYDCTRTAIAPDETAGELRERLVGLGTPLLVATVATIEGREPHPQAGEATAAGKLSVDEFRLDATRPAAELARLVRAGNPRPGAWAMIDGRRLKVLRAHPVEGTATVPVGCIDLSACLATSDGLLLLDEVQPEGKSAMRGSAWRAGVRRAEPAIEP